MLVDTRSCSATIKPLLKAMGYRKRRVFLENSTFHELNSGYWSGGSRSTYSLWVVDHEDGRGHFEPLAYPTDPYEFGGRPAPVVAIPEGCYVVEGGTFRGKTATATIIGLDAETFFGGRR